MVLSVISLFIMNLTSCHVFGAWGLGDTVFYRLLNSLYLLIENDYQLMILYKRW